jgi:hypothetical protein
MPTLPAALVISDFPIIGRTVRVVFRDRYAVHAMPWAAFIAEPERDSSLVIVDVTTMDAETVLGMLTRLLSVSRVVLCSLHHNEVQVYRVEHGAYSAETAFPDLFALAA